MSTFKISNYNKKTLFVAIRLSSLFLLNISNVLRYGIITIHYGIQPIITANLDYEIITIYPKIYLLLVELLLDKKK